MWYFLLIYGVLIISPSIINYVYHIIYRKFQIFRVGWNSLPHHNKILSSIERIKAHNNLVADKTIAAVDRNQIKLLSFKTVHELAGICKTDEFMRVDEEYDELCQEFDGFYDVDWKIAAINTDRSDKCIDDTIVHEVQHYYNSISDTEYDSEEDEVQARRAEYEFRGKYITRGLMKKIRTTRWRD